MADTPAKPLPVIDTGDNLSVLAKAFHAFQEERTVAAPAAQKRRAELLKQHPQLLTHAFKTPGDTVTLLTEALQENNPEHFTQVLQAVAALPEAQRQAVLAHCTKTGFLKDAMNQPIEPAGLTALGYAAAQNKPWLVKDLIRAGAPIDLLAASNGKPGSRRENLAEAMLYAFPRDFEPSQKLSFRQEGWIELINDHTGWPEQTKRQFDKTLPELKDTLRGFMTSRLYALHDDVKSQEKIGNQQGIEEAKKVLVQGYVSFKLAAIIGKKYPDLQKELQAEVTPTLQHQLKEKLEFFKEKPDAARTYLEGLETLYAGKNLPHNAAQRILEQYIIGILPNKELPSFSAEDEKHIAFAMSRLPTREEYANLPLSGSHDPSKETVWSWSDTLPLLASGAHSNKQTILPLLKKHVYLLENLRNYTQASIIATALSESRETGSLESLEFLLKQGVGKTAGYDVVKGIHLNTIIPGDTRDPAQLETAGKALKMLRDYGITIAHPSHALKHAILTSNAGQIRLFSQHPELFDNKLEITIYKSDPFAKVRDSETHSFTPLTYAQHCYAKHDPEKGENQVLSEEEKATLGALKEFEEAVKKAKASPQPPAPKLRIIGEDAKATPAIPGMMDVTETAAPLRTPSLAQGKGAPSLSA